VDVCNIRCNRLLSEFVNRFVPFVEQVRIATPNPGEAGGPAVSGSVNGIEYSIFASTRPRTKPWLAGRVGPHDDVVADEARVVVRFVPSW